LNLTFPSRKIEKDRERERERESPREKGPLGENSSPRERQLSLVTIQGHAISRRNVAVNDPGEERGARSERGPNLAMPRNYPTARPQGRGERASSRRELSRGGARARLII